MNLHIEHAALQDKDRALALQEVELLKRHTAERLKATFLIAVRVFSTAILNGRFQFMFRLLFHFHFPFYHEILYGEHLPRAVAVMSVLIGGASRHSKQTCPQDSSHLPWLQVLEEQI